MLIEKVTVTNTPLSVHALVVAARPGKTVPTKSKTITFKYAAAETKVVLISDEDTATPITLLDNATESIRAASIDDFSLTKSLLHVASGTVLVDILVSETLT